MRFFKYKLVMIPHHLRLKCYLCDDIFNKKKGMWLQDENQAQHRICPICAEKIRNEVQ